MHRNKSQFARLLELDRSIRDGEYPNCNSFAKKYETSAKTVQRDIEYLRDQLGAPVEYDIAHTGYRYTQPDWFLPAIHLSEGDLFSLMVATRAMEMYQGTPVGRELERVFAKICQNLPAQLTIRPELIHSQFSFTKPASKPVREEIWTLLVRGLLHRRSLRFMYLAPERTAYSTRIIDPYHIANLQGEWYVFAWDHRKKRISQFAIPRIHRPILLDQRFTIPASFDPAKILGTTFGRFALGAKPKLIKLRFNAEAAYWVQEREVHPRQKIRELHNGDIELSFPAAGLYEVQRWVLGWGHRVTVLAPTELKKMVADEIRKMARQLRRFQ